MMKERLQEYALIAEIISAVCIVLSLLFVGFQIQQSSEETQLNTRAILSNSRQVSLQSDMALITTMLSNPEANVNATKPISELSFIEQEQVANLLAGFIRSREFAWSQFQNGVLDKSTMDSYMGTLIRWIKVGEVTQMYWDIFSKEIDPDFVVYVNSMLDAPPH